MPPRLTHSQVENLTILSQQRSNVVLLVHRHWRDSQPIQPRFDVNRHGASCGGSEHFRKYVLSPAPAITVSSGAWKLNAKLHTPAFVLCIAQMVLIGVASVYAAISFPIVLGALYFIQKFYLRTSRQLRLLDLEAKSPLYSQFMECLSGLATIRAFGWQKALEEKNCELLDQSQKPFYLLFAVQRWLTLVLDLMVAAVAVILIVLVVTLRGTISPGFVGVALLNVILFSQSIKMLLTFWTNLETHIGSIARIKSFTTTTVSEHLPGESQTPPPSWPSKGAIEFKNVSAAYR